jgi:Sortase and related acyltransferases
MIRHAAEADLPAIMEIIAAVVLQMREEGSDQWDEGYPARANFRADIEHGCLYVDAEGEELRAVACFNRDEPAEYAPIQWSREEAAIVIHRLAVHPTHRNRGIAKELFRFAEELARRDGTSYIRSDTYSLNTRMNALFAKMGYRRTGVIRFLGRRSDFYCYDKVLR